MFGFAFAFACLASFVMIQRGGPHRHRRFRRHRHHHHGRGPWGALRARPEQRDALADVMKELRDELEPLRETLGRSRTAFADALRGDDPAPPAVDAAFESYEDALKTAQRACGDAFAKIHAILDPEQRERLARALERGGACGGRRFAFGPYR
jgi:Spy/CpxP family protein refolding chaperone